MKLFGINNWVLLGIGVIFACAAGAIPILVFAMLGTTLLNFDKDSASKLGAIVTGIAVAAFFITFISDVIFSFLQQSISLVLKQEYYSSCLRQEIGFFDFKKAGSLINSMNSEIVKTTEIYSTLLQGFIQHLFQFFAGFLIALIFYPVMTLLIMISIPVTILMVGVFGKALDYFANKISEATSSSVEAANEVIGSIRTVRSMAGEDKEISRFSNTLRKIRGIVMLNALSKAFSISVISFFIWGSVALAYYWVGIDLQSGDGTIQKFMTAYLLLQFAIVGAQQSISIFPEIIKSQASATVLLKVILRSPAIRFRGGLKPDKLRGRLSFQDITFRYPTRPNVTILNHFNLEIEEGQSVALVGQSGSGKSTVVGLIERWYEPESGVVKVDGVDIREIDSVWLHRYLGIVSQEPTLFATTIRDNISYTVDTINKHIRDDILKINPNATNDDINPQLVPVDQQLIINAARAANCHDFITKLPDGYDTMIGERGVSLSGGQKQRIAIARAVLQNPKVLLLDEATSALDTKSESLVQDALNNLMKGRTSIIIAHRLTTVQDCDNIVVVHRGQVVEMGTHHDLMKRVGPYYNLAIKQMQFVQPEKQLTFEPDESEDEKSDDSSISTINVDVSHTVQSPDTMKPLLKRFNFYKKSKLQAEDSEIIDIREPKRINLFSIFRIMGVFHTLLLLISYLCSAIMGCIPILIFYFFGMTVRAITFRRDGDGFLIPAVPGFRYDSTIWYFAGWIAIIAAISAVASFFGNMCCSYVNDRLNEDMRLEYFSSIVKQEIGFFDIKKTGKLLSTMGVDVQNLNEAITIKAFSFIEHMFQFLMGIILSISTSWQSALVMLAAGGPLIAVTILVGSAVINVYDNLVLKSSGSALASASETINAIRTVKSMAGEERQMQSFANELEKIKRYGHIRALYAALMKSVQQFIIWGASSLTLWYGLKVAWEGGLQVGDLMQVFGLMLLSVMGVGFAMAEVHYFIKAGTCYNNIMKIISRKPAILHKGGFVPKTVHGSLEFRDITFSYPSRPNMVVMKKFNLKVEKGQHVALVGESGSGKSTITGLIEHFYEPTEGISLLDGVDIRVY
ncbi:ATP-binding cassette, subfamily B [Acrasis kona]|uniref:ATP-binding cassette, subfamily B n=1 Tax=Acrasis kona TaxID=1008807 RepID=A0AAW2Z987_9EUKA